MTATAILAQADRILAACTPDAVTLALQACRPAARPFPPAPFCLIHTDPAADDLAEDVSVLLSPAFLTLYNRPLIPPGQRRRFLDTLADPELEARLPALEPAYAWRLAAYCARRAQTTPDPALSTRYRAAALAQAADLQSLPVNPT